MTLQGGSTSELREAFEDSLLNLGGILLDEDAPKVRSVSGSASSSPVIHRFTASFGVTLGDRVIFTFSSFFGVWL